MWEATREPCCLRDISANGALFDADVLPPLGIAAEVSHPSLGQLSGIVVRHTKTGFALALAPEERSAFYALKALTQAMLDRPDRKVL